MVYSRVYLVCLCFICCCVQQVVFFGYVEFEQLVVFVGVFVDFFGVVVQFVVDGGNCVVGWGVDVVGGFD